LSLRSICSNHYQHPLYYIKTRNIPAPIEKNGKYSIHPYMINDKVANAEPRQDYTDCERNKYRTAVIIIVHVIIRIGNQNNQTYSLLSG
jgi:hypothetical protein